MIEDMSNLLRQLTSALRDHYVVQRELGHGGMAVVFLAHDLRHDRDVALKVVRPDLAASLGVDRFLREIQIAAKLAHPNIIPLYDSGVEEGHFYYVMPFITGESLRDRLNGEKQLPIDDALQITSELADALGYAHALGVIHRDIKPENVLFQAGHAMIADFGIARAVSVAGGERLTETGIAVGSPAYMSPEQAIGDSEIDARSDIYSLGCVLYEMLAGDPPFVASTAQAILASKLVGKVSSLSIVRETVPHHVEAAINIALARLPVDRYETAQEFSAALAGEVGGGGNAADQSTIAVLPFTNMSADTENEYFSDGITEEVINAVARIANLRVTARTSVFQFKGKEHDIREIGQRLNVGMVLEGSVRKAGGRVRVTAQLIDVSGGHHLWSERFDYDISDVFAIQDEISLAIAERLRREFTGSVIQPSGAARLPEYRPDPVAFDAYLRGRYHRRQMFGGGDAIEKTGDAYREAIEKDPTFALAYSALAELYIVLAIGFAIRPSRELMPQAKEAADRSISLNPELAEAQLSRALVAMYYDREYAVAKAGIERAIALNPSSVDAHFWAEFYYTYVEHSLEKAVTANRQAAELDPLDLSIASRLGQVLIIFGRVDEAIDHLEGILRLDPDHMVTYLELADAYSRIGDYNKAIDRAERAIALSGRAVAALGVSCVVFAASGKPDSAAELLQELVERAQHGYVVPFWLAVAYASVGELDRSFEYLDEAQRTRDPNALYISAAPKSIRWQADPRFGQIMSDMGLGHLVGDDNQ